MDPFFDTLEPLPEKSRWYRIEEREKSRTPIKPVWMGDWIEYSRAIVRAGYFMRPTDMPADLLKERVLAHIRNSMNMVLASTPKGERYPKSISWKGSIEQPRLMYNEPHDGPVTNDMVHDFLYSLYLGPGKLNDLIYDIRGDWFKDQSGSSLRTFWYIDLKDARQVREVVTKMVGTAEPGEVYGGYYSDGYEYDPPYFNEHTRQRLYVVGYWDDITHRCPIYVHPLDVVSPLTREGWNKDDKGFH